MVHDSLQCSYSNWPSGTKQWIGTFFINGPMNAKSGFTTNLKTQQCCKWLWTTVNSRCSGHPRDYMQELFPVKPLLLGIRILAMIANVCNSRVSTRQELAVLKKDAFVLIGYSRY